MTDCAEARAELVRLAADLGREPSHRDLKRIADALAALAMDLRAEAVKGRMDAAAKRYVIWREMIPHSGEAA